MKDLREIISQNLVDLRTREHMTQINLADRLNYSDKAVSKWERGESLPDVAVLKEIAEIFGVTVDYLLSEDHDVFNREKNLRNKKNRRNHMFITLLAAGLVWMVATFLFVQLSLIPATAAFPRWLVFIYAIPACSIVVLVFNCIWGKRKFNYLIESVLLWSAILSLFLSLTLLSEATALWTLFLLGIPAEVLILLFAGLKFGRSEPKEPRKKTENKKGV